MIDKNISAGKYIFEHLNSMVYFYVYFFVGFLVPFTLGHPQLLVGTLVNATLVLAALKFDSNKKILPLLFAPSLGVLARGLIFGPMTPFLVIMLPFIWTSNAILVYLMKNLHKDKEKNYGISLGISALAKSGFLFSVAFILVSVSVLPAVFLTAMGIVQLTTALSGGILAFALYKTGINRISIE
jgi:hypothetical protein